VELVAGEARSDRRHTGVTGDDRIAPAEVLRADLGVEVGWIARATRGTMEVVSTLADVAVVTPAIRRSTAPRDVFMRRLLRIPPVRTSRRARDVHGIFSISMVISGMRCLVSYIVLPLLAPIFGATAGAGPAFGVPISVVALVFDVRGVRRFWLADHPRRWEMTAVYAAVMTMVITFLVIDCVSLAR
jgi:hypothetical protein